MNQTAEISLVKQTPFEELVTSLVEKQSKSDLEIIRKRRIIKEILSVYSFMKIQFAIKHQSLDLETFEVVRKQLYKIANEEVEIHKKKWWWLGLRPPRIKRWERFIRFGYFDPIEHPSGHSFYSSLLSYSDLEDVFSGRMIDNSWDIIPPNLKDLTLALFKERFGKENE